MHRVAGTLLFAFTSAAFVACAAKATDPGTGATTSDTTTSASGGAAPSSSDAGGMGTGGMTGAGGMTSGPGTGGMGSGGMGTGGMGTGGMGTGGSGPMGKVLAFGTLNSTSKHEIERIDLPAATKTAVPLMGLTAADITSVALSPDGKKLAVAGADTGTSKFVLNVYAADGSGAPTTLVTTAANNQHIQSIAWSPDGVWIALMAELDINGQVGLYVVKAAGGSAAKRVSQMSADTMHNVSAFSWARSADATHAYLAFTGDMVTDKVYGLWVVDAVPSTLTEIVPQNKLAVGQTVQANLGWDKANKIYFKSNHEVAATYRLYRANVDGSMLEQVPGTKKTNGAGEASVGNFAIAPDGAKIAFAAESPNKGINDVYVGDAGMDNATQVSKVQTMALATGTSGPSFFSEMAWSADQKRLAVAADWITGMSDVDNAYSLWVLPTSGSPGGVRLFGKATVATQQVDTVAFSGDGARLFATGDLSIDNGHELYATTDFTTADQALKGVTLRGVPDTNHDVDGFVVLP